MKKMKAAIIRYLFAVCGFSEKEISHLVDMILNEINQKPAMAIVTEQVLDWTVREYIEAIRTEHSLYSDLNHTKDIVSGEKI